MEKKNIPGDHHFQSPPTERQHLDKKAEEYLREGGNIEDMPNAKDEEDEQRLLKALKDSKEAGKIEHEQGASEEKEKSPK